MTSKGHGFTLAYSCDVKDDPCYAAFGAIIFRRIKVPRIEVVCSECNNIIIFETEDTFYAFNCRCCTTIYAYSKKGDKIHIEIVRSGINIPKDIQEAFKILDLSLSCYSEEIIKRARRKQIELYHPDKVDFLGKEFIELANRKTKEINAAYETIIGWLEKEKKHTPIEDDIIHDLSKNKHKYKDQAQWNCPKCKTINANEVFVCIKCRYVNNNQWAKMK